ncbi:DM9 domain-containing protein [Fasciola gigantica]|uniref:DM9 domain-containing protein n=1 Tax=Fasciola gigantica TaxID=46835 RepID=A0A504YNC4_FASGI|nr:DM9 domain-containing protein [Fasciola gigantica]
MARINQGFQAGLSWVHDRDGNVPSNAIDAGDGIYIGRLMHDGDMLPAKVVPRLGKAYVCHGGREHEYHSYEVLCDTKAPGTQKCYLWEHARSGHVPKYAVLAGLSESGDPIYVARSEIDGERVVGKIHSGHDCAYFPYGGREHQKNSYEVLVMKK